MKKKTKKITTCKGMLRELRKFFRQSPRNYDERLKLRDQQRNLWNILTALRGPDSGNKETKHCTTAVIRHAFAGEKSSINCFAIVSKDSEEYLRIRTYQDGAFKTESRHFRCHAHEAFTALGLKWKSVNKQ